MGRVYEFLANTADGAFAVDRRQTIVMWNSAATSMLGHRASVVLGRMCYEVLRGRDASGCAVCRSGCTAFEAARRLDAAPTTELATGKADGNEVWLSMSTVVVPSRRRELSVLVHLFREVTSRHQLVRVVQELAALVGGLSLPAGDASHAMNDNDVVAIELTRREREILGHLAAGESTEVIADRLFVTARTVRNHVTHVLTKLGVHSRLEAVAHATRNGMLGLCWLVFAALG